MVFNTTYIFTYLSYNWKGSNFILYSREIYMFLVNKYVVASSITIVFNGSLLMHSKVAINGNGLSIAVDSRVVWCAT